MGCVLSIESVVWGGDINGSGVDFSRHRDMTHEGCGGAMSG